jgi:hypothetical protein
VSRENGERRGSRDGRKRRKQHERTRYARGVVPPGSRATSRTKGSRRKLGDLVSPAIAIGGPGRRQEAERRSCRGRGEESDGLIVPVKRRTTPAPAGRGGGGGKGAGRGELMAANDVPGTAPDHTSLMRCHHRYRNCMGRPSPERRCRRLSTRAGCGQDACPDPCGGRGVTHVPTATRGRLCTEPPHEITHWTGRAMAKKLSASRWVQ